MTQYHLTYLLSTLAFRLLVAGTLAVGLILGIATAFVAYAATFTVNSSADVVDANPGDGVCATAGGACTLRAAIQEANALAGDDTIILPSGFYTLTISGIDEDLAAEGDLDITSNLILSGAGAEHTIINGNGLDRVFYNSGTFTISGVTIKGGHIAMIGGGGIINGGRLTLAESIVTDNVVTGSSDGGGIYNAGTLQLINSTVLSNTAGSEGGGIYNLTTAGVVTLTASTVINNSAGSCGGFFNDGGTVNLTNSSVISNTGGGLCNFSFLGTGILSLTDSTVRGNRRSGGISVGGGINNVSILTVTRSTFLDNQASNGGAIYSSGPVTITNSTISSNSATSNGGGFFFENQLASLNNVTVVDNVADSDNNGSGDGGGIYVGLGTMTFNNTLMARNVDRGGQRPDCRGTLSSQDYNLIQDTSGCTIVGDTTGNIVGQDPNLGPVQDNGGSTVTYALLTDSPAIDAGNPNTPGSGGNACEYSDQRGTVRPQGTRCDIGAYEVSKVQFSVATQTVTESVGPVTMTVNLSVAGGLTVTVPYTVSGTSTGGGIDHNLTNGTFSISSGTALGTMTFDVINDTLVETDETIIVTLGVPTNAVLDTTTVQTITIQDNGLMEHKSYLPLVLK